MKAKQQTTNSLQKGLRNVFLGMPMDEAKARLPRRDNASRTPHGLSAVVGWACVVLFTGWGIMAGYQAFNATDQGGRVMSYTLLWFYAGLAYVSWGYVLDKMPKSPKVFAQLFATYALGILAIPFVMQFLETQNIVLGILATVVVVPLAMVMNHTFRNTALHHQGYKV